MSKSKGTLLPNTFTGGLDRDSHPAFINPSDVTFRLNSERVSNRIVGKADINERGTTEIVSLPKKIVGSILIEERDWIIYFSKDNGDAIGYVDLAINEYKEILTAQEFGCNWYFNDCEWLSIDYDYISGCDELKLYFSSNWTYYHVNIDEMLNPERKESLLTILRPTELGECGRTDCTYFKSFRSTCGAKVIPIRSDKGGYDLMAGVYQVAIQLIDENGSTTNVFHASEPINIGSENNIPGERSEEYISINIDNLDCAYHLVRIIIIKTIAGMTSASIVAEKNYTNGQVSFNYYGTNGEEVPITLPEVRVAGKTYIEGKDLFIHNNKAWYYTLKPDKNPDLQRKVFENIKTKYVVYSVPIEDVVKNGYKSLMRSERYLLGIVYNIKGKPSSPVYVLLPTQATASPGGTPPTPTLIANTPDIVNYEYEAAALLRYRGTGGGCVGGGCGEDGGGECGGGTCGGAIEVRAEKQEAEEAVAGFVSTIKSAIEDIDTTIQDICRVLDCESHTCNQDEPPDCVGCETECCDSPCDECECEYRHKGAEICQKDWSDIEKLYTTMLDWSSGLSQDLVSPTYTSTSIKEAAIKLIEDGVENKVVKVYVAPQYTTDMDGKEFANSVAPPSGTDGSDNNVDNNGNKLTNPNVVKIAEGYFTKATTSNDYPDTLNCEGEFVYGEYAGTPVQLFEVPGSNKIPLYTTFSSGVVSPVDPGNTEWSKTYINLIGVELENIYIPTTEELGGEICEDDPVTVVMVERTFANSRVLAKGITHGTFRGVVNGRPYAYPKHAVNSIEKIDRFINEEKSRLGSEGSGEQFTFHSIDTNVYHMGLAVTDVKVEMMYKGFGYRYGHYALGSEPEDSIYGRRHDMRGTRSAHNLNDWELIKESGQLFPVDGITYAKGNRIVTNPKGIDLPLMNRYRESSVYLQAPGIPDYNDFSFIGDVLEHSRPLLEGYTNYVALIRDFDNQYGSLVNQAYISTGLEGHRGTLTTKTLSGICGDTYIGFNSVKRTSYISDKVGGAFNVMDQDPTKTSARTVCDTPEAWDDKILGMYYATRLPESGDVGDAKNWAGLHSTASHTPTYTEVVNGYIGDPEELPMSEWYYPRTLSHMNYYIGESVVCPWLRQTGEGNQILQKKVYYPQLKDNDLDPAIYGRVWEECFLSDFRDDVEQPSKAMLNKKFWLMALVNQILPGLHLAATAMFAGNPAELTAYTAITPALVGAWLFLKENLLTEQRINEFVGIPTCKTDAEGGQDDKNIEGWKDNYLEYNSDYSFPDKVNVYRGLPDPYYTCNCDDIILGETTNEIKWSRIKMIGSYLDNYISVPPLNSLLIPTKYGKVKKLFVESGRFYAHTDKQLLLLQEGTNTIQTKSGLELSLGGGNLLEIPEGAFKTVPEGFIGLQDPNASFTTPFGQIFIDSNARAIYIMRGGQPERISDYGMSRFFWENIPMDCSDCKDEKNGRDYLFGVSYENKLLYFTKRDCNCSFTVSYDLVSKRWYSFHSFIPDFYAWNRDSLFSVSKGKLWQHGTGEMQTYYGDYYPYVLEFVAKQSPILSAIEYKSTLLDTVAIDGNKIDTDVTFNKVAIYTMTQSSGEKELRIIKDRENQNELIREHSYVPVKWDGRRYNFNEIQNNAKSDSIITKPYCYTDDIQLVSGAGYFENQFFDDYIVTRLTLDNIDKKVQLLTKYVGTYVEPRQDS